MARRAWNELLYGKDPDAPAPDERLTRLQQLEEGFRQYPGRAPSGTGLTGIMPHDRYGYDTMLGERTEYLNLLADIEGRRRPDIEAGQGRFRAIGGIVPPQNAIMGMNAYSPSMRALLMNGREF